MVVQVDINGKVNAKKPGFLRGLFSEDRTIHKSLVEEMGARHEVGQILFDDTARLDHMLAEVVVRHIDQRTEVVPIATQTLVTNYASQGLEQANRAFEVASLLLDHGKDAAAKEVYDGIIYGILDGNRDDLTEVIARANIQGLLALNQKRYNPLSSDATDVWETILKNDPAFADSRYKRSLVEKALFSEPIQKRTELITKLGIFVDWACTPIDLIFGSPSLSASWPVDKEVHVSPGTHVARGSFVLSEKDSRPRLAEAVNHYDTALKQDIAYTRPVMKVGEHYTRTGQNDFAGAAFYAVLKAHKEGDGYRSVWKEVNALNPLAASIFDALISENFERIIEIGKTAENSRVTELLYVADTLPQMFDAAAKVLSDPASLATYERVKTAKSLLSYSIQGNSGNVSRAKDLVQHLMQAGHYNLAEETAIAIKTAMPQSSEAWKLIGNAVTASSTFLSPKRHAWAETCYTEAKRLEN